MSDTAVFTDVGKQYGFGPVVRELEVLQHMFDEIVWLSCGEHKQVYADTLITANNIRLVSMPSVRHARLNILFVLLAYPVFLFQFFRHIGSATHVHSRGPSHPAIISVLFSFIDKRRSYWHKYAGDWVKKDVPFMYRLQRSLLKRLRGKNIKVTVNGKWDGGTENIIALENPAVYSSEFAVDIQAKNFSRPLNLLFVGNLTKTKGIAELTEAMSQLPGSGIAQLSVAGGGELKSLVDELANADSRIKPLGYLSRQELIQYYQQSHLLVLPSHSEGFPKVIGEASAYGCIPVVSSSSAVAQYIRDGENGFLLHTMSADGIASRLQQIAAMDADTLLRIINTARASAHIFTYERFAQRIETEILIN